MSNSSLRSILAQLDEPLQLLIKELLRELASDDSGDDSGTGPGVVARADGVETAYVVLKLSRHGVDELTRRERDIVRCVGMGFQNGEIAGELGITRATVSTHLRKIFGKMGVNSRVELARKSLLLS